MRPIPRIVAILDGGPYDGMRFSSALAEDQPQSLLLSGPDGDVRYEPTTQLNLDEAHQYSLEQQRVQAFDAVHPVFGGFELHDPELPDGVVQGHHFVGVWIYQVGNGG